MFLTLLMTSYAGFVLIALTMDRHEGQFLAKPLPRRWHLPSAIAGWALLLASAAIGVKGWGWGSGLTLWFGTIAVSATVLAWLLTYRPRLAIYGAAIMPLTLVALF